MGVVYLGSNAGELYAIKVLRPEFARDPVFQERFKRELVALERVASPRTPEIAAYDFSGPIAYFATRYTAGPTLSERVFAAGPLGGRELQRFAFELAEAIAWIHSKGFVHRDVKPSNVLLAADGLKLLDFGIAAAAEATHLTSTGVVLGTPAWMAPEQGLGAQVEASADVFGWGATVYFAGLGRPPFGTGRTDAVIYRLIHEEPDLTGLPSSIRSSVSLALRKVPSERPTATVLFEQFRNAAAVAGWSETQATAPASPAGSPHRGRGSDAGRFHRLRSGKLRGISIAVSLTVAAIPISLSFWGLTQSGSVTETDSDQSPAPSTDNPTSSAATQPEAPAVPPPAPKRFLAGMSESPNVHDAIGDLHQRLSRSEVEVLLGPPQRITPPYEMDPTRIDWTIDSAQIVGWFEGEAMVGLDIRLPPTGSLYIPLAGGVVLGDTILSDLPRSWMGSSYRETEPGEVSYIFCTPGQYSSEVVTLGADQGSARITAYSFWYTHGPAAGCPDWNG